MVSTHWVVELYLTLTNFVEFKNEKKDIWREERSKTSKLEVSDYGKEGQLT